MKPPNIIDIWIIDTNNHTSEEDFLFSLLNAEEKERALRFISKEHTFRYTVCQAKLRTILASYLSVSPESIEYRFGPYKKPYLKDSSLKLGFNLSHSHNMALIAVSQNHEVGIDIEKLNPATLEKSLEETIFSPKEMQNYRNTPQNGRLEAFFSAWTHKEAIVKLIGVGLYKEIKELEVPLHTLSQPTAVQFDQKSCYLKSFYIESAFIGAIASHTPDFSITFFRA